MLATISSARASTKMSHGIRDFNKAGAPLPGIPRRASSSSRITTLSVTAATAASVVTPTRPAAPVLNIQGVTPPEHNENTTIRRPMFTLGDVGSPSSSGGSRSDEDDAGSVAEGGIKWPSIASRSKKAHNQRVSGGLHPPEFSTPTPSVHAARNAALKDSSLSSHRPPFSHRHHHQHLQHHHNSSADTQAPVREHNDEDNDDTPRASKNERKIDAAAVTASASTPLGPTVSDRRKAPSLKLDIESPTSPSFQIPSSVEAKLIRKKSGEPLKSSLKSSKPPQRGDLSIVTLGLATKSEPNTPSHAKNVSFDSHLEHVKLFHAEQKPLAVSRDGSPTDTDASGTDTDWPAIVFGGVSVGERARKAAAASAAGVQMNVINMPSALLRQDTTDLVLEELKLSPDSTSIFGTVLVRNLAFEKAVAARFTFDNWQTTSEVMAKYQTSLDGARFDRFEFMIKLHGLMATPARVEGREMFLALKYTVGGREIWDNNGGKNYHAVFSASTTSMLARGRVISAPAPASVSEANSASESEMGRMGDLNSKLEEVAQERKDATSARFRNQHQVASTSQEEPPPSFKSTDSLAARYDFARSLKNGAWRRPSLSPPTTSQPNGDFSVHTRCHSYPAPSGSASSSPMNSPAPSPRIPWNQPNNSNHLHHNHTHHQTWHAPRHHSHGNVHKRAPPPHLGPVDMKPLRNIPKRAPSALLGSPRDLDEESFEFHKAPNPDLDELPFPAPAPATAPAMIERTSSSSSSLGSSGSESGSASSSSSTATGGSLRGRNHQRGYFDTKFTTLDTGTLRMTPTSGGPSFARGVDSRDNSAESTPTPASTSSAAMRPRLLPFPFPDDGVATSSTMTTPSAVLSPWSDSGGTTSESSESSAPSPLEDDAEDVVVLVEGTADEGDLEESSASRAQVPDREDRAEYRKFLNRFCFFTGNGTIGVTTPRPRIRPKVHVLERTLQPPTSAEDAGYFAAQLPSPLSSTGEVSPSPIAPHHRDEQQQEVHFPYLTATLDTVPPPSSSVDPSSSAMSTAVVNAIGLGAPCPPDCAAAAVAGGGSGCVTPLAAVSVLDLAGPSFGNLMPGAFPSSSSIVMP